MHRLTAAFLALVLSVSGCNTTGITTARAPETSYAHHAPVKSRVDPAYYRAMPDCVTVLPIAPGTLDRGGALRLEEAVALRLRGIFGDVIGPRRRAAIARSNGIDESIATDRKAFIAALGCRYFIRITPHNGTGRHYSLFWTEVSASLSLTLFAFDTDGKERGLWQSRGTRRRGDGGIPVSVLSAAGSAVRAGRMASDPEVMASVTDDVLRAMIAELPNLQHATVSTRAYRRP